MENDDGQGQKRMNEQRQGRKKHGHKSIQIEKEWIIIDTDRIGYMQS